MEVRDTLSKFPYVAVVTVTRNRCDMVLRVFSQVSKLDYPRKMLDIFLIDNASTDGTVEEVRQRFPDVFITLSDKNLGPTPGWNIGIKEVLKAQKNYKYIWLLDDDVKIEQLTLMSLIKEAERDPHIAVVGSVVYDLHNPEQLVTAGLHIDWNKPALFYNIPEPEKVEELFDVTIMPACSSLIRTDLYRKLGLFDERLRLYWGDTEWCVRAIRNGYRVCCSGKSKVWHRNWVNIKPDFSFPYAIHGRVQSELFFHLFYNPHHSISGVRNMILKSYLKAAFENLTLRPNFSRAYDKGVQDFLKVNLSKEGFSSWSDDLKLSGIDEICRTLSGKVSESPKIILNQIADESQKTEIKKIFQKYFHQIRWKEIPVRKSIESVNATDRLHVYLFSYFPKLLFNLLIFFNRSDVIISSVSTPYLYNIAAARYTIFFDQSLQGCFLKNRILSGLMKLFKTLFRGLWIAYFDLPRALKNVHLGQPILHNIEEC